jgi:diguanylate cyclase (GGDEF)-like protein
MAEAPTVTAEDPIKALWAKHLPGVLEQVGVVERAVAELIAGSLEESTRRDAHREAHKLAGSLGTFGFWKASELAREIELALEEGRNAGPGAVPALAQAVVGIRADIEREPDVEIARPGVTPSAATEPLVLVVDDDELFVRRIAADGTRRGLRVQLADSPQAAKRAVAQERPDIVLLDLGFPDGVASAYELISSLSAHEPPIPVMALTVSDSFADRVEVARRGGCGFVHKTKRPEQAMDAVMHYLERARAGATTILAVDDDPALLDALRALLERQDVRVATLADPHRFWDVLEELTPDLVVLDVDMPGLSGLELCRVLRNDARWQGTPVVFLTARTDRETVQQLFAAGADDYVAKPLVGAELTVRVDNRLERTRLFRALAETDGLTGIANRRRAAEMLEQLIRLSARYGQPLSVASIDLDGFKRINDRFGHAAGDTVLLRLAELLQRTFRGEDVVARWGGEEFLIAMYGMARHDGVRRVGELLERFRGEEFRAEHGAFSLTFSAGLAQYPDDATDTSSLLKAADDALYAAKQAGRASVVPARRPSGEIVDAVDVAVVEDDDVLAELLVHTLETEGYRTRRFSEGDRAAAALGGPAPDVPAGAVLLDVNLPGLDGLSVLRRLAAEGTLRRTRVVMLTARSAEEEVVKALELGAFDHVAKPFSMPVLIHKVQRALDGR